MGLVGSAQFSKIVDRITANTIFKDSSHFFENRLIGLPGNSTSLFGFETLLGKGLRNPDVAICFTKGNFHLLADWCYSFLPKLDSRNYWSTIKGIVKGNSLCEHLKLVWIEMDRFGSNINGVPEPGFFLELLEGTVKPEFIRRNVLPIVTGNKNHPSNILVESCLNMLPNTGRLVHLGYFPARSTEKIRMTISFNQYQEIAPYCSRIFGKDLNRQLQTRIEELSEFSDFPVLHLDIGKEIETRLGIEMRFKENELNPEYQWRWRDVFSRLIDRGLCSSEQAESILGFSGITRYIDETTLSPSWYKYFLYYIKGVFDFSGREHYKAYCAFQRQSAN